jgi:FkbM family methyltransferase
MYIQIHNFFSKLVPYKIKIYLKKKRKFNSINKLDRKMLKYINYENGFFIECGANDGVDQSNTWHYEKYLNWKGILIEPLPNKFFELRRNRDINNHYFNVALVDNKFKEEIVELIDTGLTSTFKILNNKDHSLNPSIHAKVKTLTKVLEESNSPKEIDFFSLDVEGAESVVLEGINFEKYTFKYLLIETENFDKINKYLQEKRYIFLEKLSHHDFLFSKEK